MAGRAMGLRRPIQPLCGAAIALVVASAAAPARAQPAPAPAATADRPAPPRRAPAAGRGPRARLRLAPTAPAVRPLVAVIDLRADEDSKMLAGALAAAVGRRPELALVADAGVAGALVGPIEDGTARALKEATHLLDESRAKMGEFDLVVAADRARSGLYRVLETTPTSAATELLADLAFAEGQARLANGQPQLARTAFTLVHRLSPGRALDRAEHPPKLIEAFTAAATPPTGSATLQIVATGTVWVDGRVVGDGPRTVQVAPGAHVVMAAGPTLLPTGLYREVVDGQTIRVDMAPEPAPLGVLASRARQALIDARDEAALTLEMKALAGIVDLLPGSGPMTAAVIVTTDEAGGSAVRLWRGRQLGFTAVAPVERPLLDRAADQLVEPLVPPAPEPDPIVVDPGPIVQPPRPWYRNGWVQAGIVGGVVAIVAGGWALSNAIGADSRRSPTGLEMGP